MNFATRPETEPQSLSSSQRQIWAKANAGDPASIALQLNSQFILHSRIDADILNQAFRDVVSRHRPLRADFLQNDDAVTVESDRNHKLCLSTQNCDSQADCLYAAKTFAAAPLSAATGPVVRFGLFSHGKDHHVVSLAAHRICMDRDSLKNFWDELSTVYNARKSKSEPELPGLENKYADFSHGHDLWLDQGQRERQLSYWSEKLYDAPAPLRLPYDHPKVAPGGNGFLRCETKIAAPQAAAIESFAKENDTGLFETFLLSYGSLLARYAQSEEMLIATPVSIRPHIGGQNLIGCFENTLLLRPDLDGGLMVCEAMQEMNQLMREALDHPDLPQDELLQHLAQSTGETPKAQTSFQYLPDGENAARPNFNGCAVEPLKAEAVPSDYELSLSVSRSGKEFKVAVEFREDLFATESITRFLDHYRQFLESLVIDSEQYLEEVDFLSEAELEHLAALENGDDLETGEKRNVLEAIRQYEPFAKPALLDLENKVSHLKCGAHSDAFARVLLAEGTEKGHVIAVLMPHSPAAVVALLSVLKTGAAFVYIDPELPEARIRFMINDAGSKFLIAPSEEIAAPFHEDAQFVAFQSFDDIDTESVAALADPTPNDLAYITYTSSPAQKPKGICITHGNLLSAVESRSHCYSEIEEPRVLVPAKFDLNTSISVLFWTLCKGGAAILPSNEELDTADSLAKLIAQRDATTLVASPRVYESLLASDSAKLESLETVILAGEVYERSLPERHATALPNCQLVNEYGATETSGLAAVHRFDKKAAATEKTLIGSPVAGAEIRILDAFKARLAQGHIGEIHIAGRGLSPGYHRRAMFSLRSFCGSEDGTRLYATGDFGRWNDKGEIEYLGRPDARVKIDGYRVEAREVEEAICLHPDLEKAIVVAASPDTVPSSDETVEAAFAHDDRRTLAHLANGGQPLEPTAPATLTAFVTATSGSAPLPAEELKTYLAKRLPEYLIPTRFQFLDTPTESAPELEAEAAPETPVAPQKPTLTLPEAAPASEMENIPFTPVQSWFLEQELKHPNAFCQSIVVDIDKGHDIHLLRLALVNLISRHDGLRLKIAHRPTGWVQRIAELPATHELAEECSLKGESESSRRSQLDEIESTLRDKIKLENGSLIFAQRIAQPGDEKDALLIVAHRLAVDTTSWKRLVEELQSLLNGEELDDAIMPLSRWAKELDYFTHSQKLLDSIPAWASQAYDAVKPLPRKGGDDADNSEAATSTHAYRFDKKTSLQLLKAAQSSKLAIPDLLLASLSLTLKKWTGNDVHLISLRSEGREDIGSNFSPAQIVGGCECNYPLVANISEAENPLEALADIVQQRRSNPLGGMSFGIAKYSEYGDKLTQLPRPEIAFTFTDEAEGLGENARFLSSEHSYRGESSHPENTRQRLLEVNARIEKNCLVVDWSHSKHIHNSDTIQLLANNLAQALEAYLELLPNTQGEEVRYPLSSTQQQALLLHLANSQEGKYSARATLEGELELKKVIKAWKSVEARNPVLRSRFDWLNCTPAAQFVGTETKSEIEFHDLSKQDKTIQLARLNQLENEYSKLPAELEGVPKAVLRLIRHNAKRHTLLWNFHSIALDDASGKRVIQELVAALNGDTPPEKEEDHWHENRLLALQASPTGSTVFWRQYLDKATPTLLASHPFDPVPRHTHNQSLPVSIGYTLKQNAAALGTQAEALATAAWAQVLCEFSEQENCCFETTIAPRSETGIADNLVRIYPLACEGVSQKPILKLAKETGRHQKSLSSYAEFNLNSLRCSADGIPTKLAFDTRFSICNAGEEAADKRINLLQFKCEGGPALTAAISVTLDLSRSASIEINYAQNAITRNQAELLVEAYHKKLMGCIELQEITDALPDTSALAASFREERETPETPPVTAASVPAAPAAKIEDDATQTLQNIFKAVLATEKCEPNDDFFTLGGTPVGAVALIQQIRNAFEKKLPLATLFRYRTPAALAECVAVEESIPESFTYLTNLAQGPSDVPTCLISCDEDASSLAAAIAQTSKKAPTWRIHPAGTENTHKLGDTVPAIATPIVEELKQVAAQGKIQLLTQGTACSLAIEIAQQLEAAGVATERLVALDSNAPGTANSNATPTAKKPGFFARLFGGWFSPNIEQTAANENPLEKVLTQYRPSEYKGKVIVLKSSGDQTAVDQTASEWKAFAAQTSVETLPDPKDTPPAQAVADILDRA